MRHLLLAAMLTTLSLPGVGHAADWLVAQGTEEGRPDDPISVGGFVQVGLEAGVRNQPATGLSEPLVDHNGEVASFNLSPTPTFLVRRARPILRGSIPGTGQRVSWFLSIEAGQSAVTRASPVVLVDASATFTALRALRLRVGRFKLPTSEEALQSHPAAGEVVPPTEGIRQLLNENTVVNGAYVGGVSGYRDVGAMVFGNAGTRKLDVSWALMVSNGGPVLGGDRAVDVTGRMRVSWLLGGSATDAHRPELAAWVWRQQGARPVDGDPTTRVRQGAGVQLELPKFRIMAEVQHGRGVLELGASPPFAGSPILVVPDGDAIGASVITRGTFGQFSVVGRWSALWRPLADPAQRRGSHAALLGARWSPMPRVRVDVNYEMRFLRARDGSPDAQAIAATMGDRLFAEATLLF